LAAFARVLARAVAMRASSGLDAGQVPLAGGLVAVGLDRVVADDPPLAGCGIEGDFLDGMRERGLAPRDSGGMLGVLTSSR
jgi:hypothetical protein